MKQVLSTHDIAHQLHNDENAGWSWSGALALAEWLQEFEENSGVEMGLDVVAIRCEFSEHGSLEELAESHMGDKWRSELGVEDDDDDFDDEIRRWANNHTTLIEFDGGVIVQDW
jgi:hypothetical protein